ncbi:MAG TPA: hypothetical protein DCE39_00330 [Planctomycetaceae bacterium]|nr:hypothetical protein [Planctomycetaceae bacterium]
MPGEWFHRESVFLPTVKPIKESVVDPYAIRSSSIYHRHHQPFPRLAGKSDVLAGGHVHSEPD